LCLRVDAGRPIAHVAAEAGISRRCLAKWYARWFAHGEDGLTDRSSRPIASPNRTSEDIADLVEALRRQTKYGPARLAAELQKLHGITVAPATVHRVLVRRGLSRLRDIDPPTGEQLREVVRYEHDRVGDLVHVDVKKLGGIRAGGGWRIHDRGTEATRASERTGPGTGKVGYTCTRRSTPTRTMTARATAATTSPHPRPCRRARACGDACRARLRLACRRRTLRTGRGASLRK
jgi:transposase